VCDHASSPQCKRQIFLSLFLTSVVFIAVLGSMAWAQSGDPRASLPEAPIPQNTVKDTQHRPNPETASSIANAPYEERKWSSYVDPGEHIPPLTSGDKLVFWLHEEAQPISLLPLFYSAGYSQLRNTDPRFGIDSAAFGERLGAAALRQASMRFFSDSLLPEISGEDPRYYREASGGYLPRSLYAVERLFVDSSDSGHRRLDISDPLGRIFASALTMTYYPRKSANGGVVLRTWGTSMGGAAVDNEFLEFWPDIVNYWRHRRNK
jgi:hypothetical protein